MGVVDVRALPPVVHRDDDREPHHDLGGRDHHREEGQHLALEVAVHPPERDEREVHGVQLELDRHEDHQRALADQHPGRPDGEQHPAQNQEVRDLRPHGTRSGSGSGAGSGDRRADDGWPEVATPCASAGSPSAPRRLSWRPPTPSAATAATISRIEVASNGKKYPLNSTFARAETFPPLFTVSSNPGAAVADNPTPRRIAVNSSATSATARIAASVRCARSFSTIDSRESTPSSMITNRNRTMIAPAYTMIWTANRNGDPSTRKNTARQKKFTIRNSAECTAFREITIPMAAATAIGANTQNTMRSVFGTCSFGAAATRPTACSAWAAARTTACPPWWPARPRRAAGVAPAAVPWSRWRPRATRTPSRSTASASAPASGRPRRTGRTRCTAGS